MPLSLAESRHWLGRGHPVSILLEAFLPQQTPADPAHYDYNVQRAAKVRSGALDIYVLPVFAASAFPTCPNLRDDNHCAIYAQRPNVCRIYPFEMNPFATFQKDRKDCPTDAWAAMAPPHASTVADDDLTCVIAAARAANIADAASKIVLCERLAASTTAWRGDGYTIHTPTVADFRAAMDAEAAQTAQPTDWHIQTQSEALGRALATLQAQLHNSTDGAHVFRAGFEKLNRPVEWSFRL